MPSSLHETIVSFLPGSERMETAGLETSVVMMPAKVQSRATAQGMPRAPSFPLAFLLALLSLSLSLLSLSLSPYSHTSLTSPFPLSYSLFLSTALSEAPSSLTLLSH